MLSEKAKNDRKVKKIEMQNTKYEFIAYKTFYAKYY